MTLYQVPDIGPDDDSVIAEIHAIRAELAMVLRAPRRWTGGLRRHSAARAIQGSNTIEGYTVSHEDAVAAVDDEPPLTADEATWAEILGYRRVLTFVLNVASEPGFRIDESTVRSMHFMLLEHELTKSPGRYRTSEIYVHDDIRDRDVYEGPDPSDVPTLMEELSAALHTESPFDPLVRGAMAHLNLVMIHPFRDGNGRMARALQTMVLAQDQLVEPAFSSIEEWLGRNTADYYGVLAATGRGAWNPANDAGLWLRFNLRAHHFQAQTMRRRFRDAELMWQGIDQLLSEYSLHERVGEALFDALIGERVTRPTYVKRSDLDERTATRDLTGAADLGLLTAHNERRARYYTAGPRLIELRHAVRELQTELSDPYPGLLMQIRTEALKSERQ
ncbi:MAG: Fic family protein [Gordonia sp. (in: high G+C Gram-positive bacteria)]